MKKIVLLVAFLFCIISCNNSASGNLNEPETLLAKEKRTQAQPKKYKGDEFGVSITSEKKDTRTFTEEMQNLPPKYEIINTVLFSHLTLWDGDLPYAPSFEIKKTIKEYTDEILFTLSVKILTFNSIKFNNKQLIQVKLNDDITKIFNCNVEYLPAPEHMISSFHIINCTLEMDIKDIHTMRLQSSDANVLITTLNNNFNFVLPKIFFTYLNEI